jgi:acyl-CoA thioesterase
MPDVAGPDQLIDAKTVLQDVLTRNDEQLNDADRTYIQYRIENLPEMFEMRPVNRATFERMQPMPADYLVWLRFKETIAGKRTFHLLDCFVADDDAIPMVHHLLAAYVSDSPMVSTSLLPHIKRDRNIYRDLHMLSLDHVWFLIICKF